MTRYMQVRIILALIFIILTSMTKPSEISEWTFYAKNKEALISLPKGYHCYYKWKDEYLDYIYMFKYNNDGTNNILIASYGSPATLHMEWDSVLEVEKHTVLEADSIYRLAYNTEEQRYYIRKYFPDANFDFMAMKVTTDFLPKIEGIFQSIVITDRDSCKPVNPSCLAQSYD